jgi:hypothetical protein
VETDEQKQIYKERSRAELVERWNTDKDNLSDEEDCTLSP